jgi:hypothetical protein
MQMQNSDGVTLKQYIDRIRATVPNLDRRKEMATKDFKILITSATKDNDGVNHIATQVASFSDYDAAIDAANIINTSDDIQGVCHHALILF